MMRPMGLTPEMSRKLIEAALKSNEESAWPRQRWENLVRYLGGQTVSYLAKELVEVLNSEYREVTDES